MITRQQMIGVIVVLLGVTIFFLIIPFGIVKPRTIEIAALAPDFWPKIIAVIIVVNGILLTFTKGNPDEEVINDWKIRFPRLMMTFGCLLLFYFVIPTLGMVVPATALIFGLMLFAGDQHWIKMTVLSIIPPVLLYIFFVYIANMPIPLGVFESLIN